MEGLTFNKGYHVQITARSDRDLTPEAIVKKVSDASGSKYSSGASTASASGPPPPISSKPAFTPTRSSGGASGFNPLANAQSRSGVSRDVNVDQDGWGQDAPQVTRTQLEKVASAYQPTKVNMRELSSQKAEPTRFNGDRNDSVSSGSDVVRGGYQPVGKVDISALRRQAQETNNAKDERPNVVKGSYEPVGKVDIAAIRARAQKPAGDSAPIRPSSISPAITGDSSRNDDRSEEQRHVADRSAPFSTSERLTSLPKPKVANRFGSANTFTGTKAPTPGAFGYESQKSPAALPVGVGRTFADQGGKTPAQLWAEKKASQRGASDYPPSSGSGGPASPMVSQTSGGGEWKSGYGGKSWAPVQTTRTGQSAGSLGEQRTGEGGENHEDAPTSPVGGVGAIRDRFKGVAPMGSANFGSDRSGSSPPTLDTLSKPNAGHEIPIPGLPSRPSQSQHDYGGRQDAPRLPTPPPQPPRSPTPPTPSAMDSGSPIRVAMPVGRGHDEVEDARDEQFSPPPVMPARSLAQVIPHEDDLTEEPSGHDPARAAAEAVAATSFGEQAAQSAHLGAHETGKRALVQYEYEKAEENELELKEGEYVTNIEMVDEDWWMGQNPRGESGLFPSNYVELVDDDGNEEEATHEEHRTGGAEPAQGAVATALYDYEAAEGNELSFPEDAKITNVVSTTIVNPMGRFH